MDIYQLPDALNLNTEGKVQIFDYYTQKSSVKNKVLLKKNVFSFLLEGTKELITKGKSILVNNNEFLLMKSGSCLMTENISENKAYRSVLLFFENSMLDDFIQKNRLAEANRPAKPYCIYPYDDYIQHFVMSLVQIKEANESLQKILLKTKFEEIMYYLLDKHGTGFLKDLSSVDDNSSNNFTYTIESNKHNNLTLQELSFLCNMSISTFKRKFKEQYKISPIKWFQQQRLEYAAYLLNVKRKRPIDIYLEIGFESLSSFTQAFKGKYQITPKQFQMEN